MNVLAFDTCFGAVSAAVRRHAPDGWIVREAFELRTAGHAERLLPMIAEVMDAAGLDFAGLDRIAVTLGPGSFTGVRGGVAAARGLALASGKPVVGATSLAVMAHRAAELIGGVVNGRPLLVAVDARRDACYVQRFAPGSVVTGEALLLSPAQAADLVGREATVVVGSAGPAVAALVRAAGGDAEPQLPDLQPHAGSLAAMAGALVPLSPASPLYLRPPDVRAQEKTALARIST